MGGTGAGVTTVSSSLSLPQVAQGVHGFATEMEMSDSMPNQAMAVQTLAVTGSSDGVGIAQQGMRGTVADAIAA